MPTKPVRIFHIESPGPLDVLEGRAEAPALCAITPLMRHKIYSQTIHSREDFLKVCRLLGTIGKYPDTKSDRPLVLHISAHGNISGSGIALGGDFVTWQDLTKMLQPFIRVPVSYLGHRIVVLSACNAHQQVMTKRIGARNSDDFVRPKYLFCTEEVLWQDAAVAWTVFYHLLPTADLDDPRTVKGMLNKIAAVGVKLHYYRWDEKHSRYKHFASRPSLTNASAIP